MMQSIRRATPVAIALVGLLLAAGCSLSDSSKSSSRIISSPFESSSASSPGDDDYQDDVRDFTAAYYKSNGRADDLRTRIAEIAGKHGVSDWEASESTFRGVGEGLGKAGARQVEVDAFKSNLATDKEEADWIQKGYESAK